MPDTAYGSAQTCRHDKTRQASHQALCADCRMLPTKGKLPTNAKHRIRIIKQHFGNLIRRFRAQLAQHGKYPGGLFRAVSLPLKTIERHIRRVGFQQQRCQRSFCDDIAGFTGAWIGDSTAYADFVAQLYKPFGLLQAAGKTVNHASAR